MWGFMRLTVSQPTLTEEDGSADIISFTLGELNEYTDGFDRKNSLRRRGFGGVYRGTIPGRKQKNVNDLQVAVKVSGNADIKMRNQWEAEIKYLSVIKHPNIIKLVGHCKAEDKYYLVYPLMENGDVMSKLQGLDWRSPFKIGGDVVHEKLKRKGCSVNAVKAIIKLGVDSVNDDILEPPTINI